jgi:hypothetical protein
MKRLLLIAAVVACSSKPKEARPITEVLAEYPGAAKAVAAAEKLFNNPLPPPPNMVDIVKAGMPPNTGISSSGITLDGPPIANGPFPYGDEMPAKPINITFLHAKAVGKISTPSYGDVNVHAIQDILTDCAGLVRNQKFVRSSSASQAAKYLKTCSELRYVLVLRTVTAVKPTEDLKAKTYTPGQFYGDALLFGLPSGKFLGSFLINVSASSTNDQKAGDTDLAYNHAVENQVVAGLKKYAGL